MKAPKPAARFEALDNCVGSVLGESNAQKKHDLYGLDAQLANRLEGTVPEAF